MNEKETARFEHYSENCPDCGGTGEFERFFGGGVYPSTIDCERCAGRGQVGNCTNCRGAGLVGKDGLSASKEPCPVCRGVGSVGDCSDCDGLGLLAAQGDAECSTCNGYGFSKTN